MPATPPQCRPAAAALPARSLQSQGQGQGAKDNSRGPGVSRGTPAPRKTRGPVCAHESACPCGRSLGQQNLMWSLSVSERLAEALRTPRGGPGRKVPEHSTRRPSPSAHGQQLQQRPGSLHSPAGLRPRPWARAQCLSFTTENSHCPTFPPHCSGQRRETHAQPTPKVTVPAPRCWEAVAEDLRGPCSHRRSRPGVHRQADREASSSLRAGTRPWPAGSRTRTWCRGWCSHTR